MNDRVEHTRFNKYDAEFNANRKYDLESVKNLEVGPGSYEVRIIESDPRMPATPDRVVISPPSPVVKKLEF